MVKKSKVNSKKKNVTLTFRQEITNNKLFYEQNLKLANEKIKDLDEQLADLKEKRCQLQGAFTALSKVLLIEGTNG
ncbi:MAG TPA: hypothetical protein ENI61_06675 [Ignavibacteria bacterium]|nr:hypothetical protein [Ignavibacteria bacterium]